MSEFLIIYYPRGRVEVSRRGIPIIYMNPNIDETLNKAGCYVYTRPEEIVCLELPSV